MPGVDQTRGTKMTLLDELNATLQKRWPTMKVVRVTKTRTEPTNLTIHLSNGRTISLTVEELMDFDTAAAAIEHALSYDN